MNTWHADELSAHRLCLEARLAAERGEKAEAERLRTVGDAAYVRAIAVYDRQKGE
jgi:hypothetical protein